MTGCPMAAGVYVCAEENAENNAENKAENKAVKQEETKLIYGSMQILFTVFDLQLHRMDI